MTPLYIGMFGIDGGEDFLFSAFVKYFAKCSDKIINASHNLRFPRSRLVHFLQLCSAFSKIRLGCWFVRPSARPTVTVACFSFFNTSQIPTNLLWSLGFNLVIGEDHQSSFENTFSFNKAYYFNSF